MTKGPSSKTAAAAVPQGRIAAAILLLRGQKIMLDVDLAELYGVPTKNLNRAVKRNRSRFPDDFMFELSEAEFEALRCQFGTSRWGGRRYRPCAFTEQGVAMLSSVLRSQRAAMVNVEIIRTFVRLRELLSSHAELARKLAALERKMAKSVTIDRRKRLRDEPHEQARRRGVFVAVVAAILRQG
ncbi:MAG: ORF6N domain-containing protein [Pseudomonadota bacterium]